MDGKEDIESLDRTLATDTKMHNYKSNASPWTSAMPSISQS